MIAILTDSTCDIPGNLLEQKLLSMSGRCAGNWSRLSPWTCSSTRKEWAASATPPNGASTMLQIKPLVSSNHITGPVLGINTGLRALALCGYCED